MDESTHETSWFTSSSSAKIRTAVSRAVTALLDALAPERELRRIEKLPGVLEQHRTPTGCILQADACALSVSWFASSAKDIADDELHVVVWRGTLARRGTPRPSVGATEVADLVLKPVELAPESYGWQAPNGERFDSPALAARCMALLEEQIAAPN